MKFKNAAQRRRAVRERRRDIRPFELWTDVSGISGPIVISAGMVGPDGYIRLRHSAGELGGQNLAIDWFGAQP